MLEDRLFLESIYTSLFEDSYNTLEQISCDIEGFYTLLLSRIKESPFQILLVDKDLVRLNNHLKSN